ncbi:MAG: ATP-binding protein [Candidatus Izemoplasmatales bacterium]|jgi:predicted AAA+ superfamily ATPase|nr:ATP-binding protein [Candidatus Izemoplasmatales bacterium]
MAKNCGGWKGVKIMIKRDSYLKRLTLAKWNGLIKIITGVRRCGKSFLLNEIFYEHLINEGVNENNIIKIALDDESYSEYLDSKKLSNYLKEKTNNQDEKYYVLIDEIQKCIGFEAVLNGLLYQQNVDVYVTGSNSKFLSKDIITEFRGRGYEIRVYPLTFSEIEYLYDNKEQALNDYLIYGGMPLIFNFKEEQGKREYLTQLFNNVYYNDIKERYKIEYIEELDNIVKVLSSSVGSLSNAKKITDTLVSNKGKGINYRTVSNYMEYIIDAFLFERVERYDIKGRKYLAHNYKYYALDLGLRNAKLNFRQIEENHLMENAIYLELVKRGLNVDVGIVEIRKNVNKKDIRKQLEVDFIVNKSDKRYYIQSAYVIPNEDKLNQELASFRNINDTFKKILVRRDPYLNRYYDEEGILHMSLMEFLTNENSLDL